MAEALFDVFLVYIFCLEKSADVLARQRGDTILLQASMCNPGSYIQNQIAIKTSSQDWGYSMTTFALTIMTPA